MQLDVRYRLTYDVDKPGFLVAYPRRSNLDPGSCLLLGVGSNEEEMDWGK